MPALRVIPAEDQDALLPRWDIPKDVWDGKNVVFAILEDVFAGTTDGFAMLCVVRAGTDDGLAGTADGWDSPLGDWTMDSRLPDRGQVPSHTFIRRRRRPPAGCFK